MSIAPFITIAWITRSKVPGSPGIVLNVHTAAPGRADNNDLLKFSILTGREKRKAL